MKLEKKYNPLKKSFLSEKQKIDWFFPVFLPSYSKIGPQQLEELYYQQTLARNLAQSASAHYAPLCIGGLWSAGEAELMVWKSKLPYSAQHQRLARALDKNNKKNLTLLQRFFLDQDLAVQGFCSPQNEVLDQIFSFLEKKSLLKRQPKLVYWDPSVQSIVNEDHIEWREELGYKLEVRCFVEAKSEVLPIVVDDVLDLFADQAVLVHHNDKRYKKHIGKNIIIPIINKPIPVYGADWVDTLNNNWVVRLNPLLDAKSLQRIQDYNLDLMHSYVDDQGCFFDASEKTTWDQKNIKTFVGNPVFSFVDNLIDIMEEVGNLISKQSQIQKVPYSKLTGQRLLKKVVSIRGVEISSIRDELKIWLKDSYGEWGAKEMLELLQKNDFLAIHTWDRFASCVLEKNWKLRASFLSVLLETSDRVLENFLAYVFLTQKELQSFSLEDLIDILMLTPELGWKRFFQAQNKCSRAHIQDYQKMLTTMDSNQLLDFLTKELQQISRIVQKEGRSDYESILPLMGGVDNFELVKLDEVFLRASLLFDRIVNAGQNMIFFAPYPCNQMSLLLVLLFASESEKKPLFVSHFPTFMYQVSPLSKRESQVLTYGGDVLSFTMAKQQKLEEDSLIASQSYLQHLWNVFRFLYKNDAFDDGESPLKAVDIRLYQQFQQLFDSYKALQKTGEGLVETLQKLAGFTQGEFSWYLEYLKKTDQHYSTAAKIFLQILQILSPYLPILVDEIESLVHKRLPRQLTEVPVLGKRDGNLDFLFELVKKLTQRKAYLQLKKHQPIVLFAKVNPDKATLLEESQPLLFSLLRIEEVENLGLNEGFPAGVETFSMLAFEFACLPKQLETMTSSLEQLEKQQKDKSLTLDYLRNTMMMLRSSPLTPTEKLEQLDMEIQQIKEDLEVLDIQIKKLKIKAT